MSNTFTIGSADADHLAIRVLGRAHPGATDYWDGNWIRSAILLRAGGFTAAITADLRTDELRRFAEGLRSLDDNLSGAAVLATMESWIELKVDCGSRGQLEVSGELIDNPGMGNRLTFELPGFDQTSLRGWIDDLAEIERSFPTIGQP